MEKTCATPTPTRRATRSVTTDGMRDATFVELRTTHFAQMEQPDVAHQHQLEFLERVG